MLQASFFKNKRVTVFGLGVNMGGVGTVQFLIEHGVREVIVTDMKKREELQSSLDKLSKYKNITYVFEQHRPEDFSHVDMVIKNPAIPWTNEYIKLAQKNNIPVEMDSSLFFAFCKAPIIGVTGTKGKTTTSTLIAHILASAGKKVVKVGIGQVGVLTSLAKITPDTLVVFELSSWRLSALSSIKKSPHIAVVTNIYPDHLNYYKTMDAYIKDKKNIFLFQKKNDTLVACFDNERVREMVQDAPGSIVWFSQQEKQDDDGVWIDNNRVWLRKAGEVYDLLSLSEQKLRGAHNENNILSAVAVAVSCGLSMKQIVTGIKSFSGVEHRLEYVREKNGVQYFNDTASTIPESALSALRSFSEPLVLIGGGSDKNLEFDVFAKEIASRVKKAILFRGSATDKIITSLKKYLPDGEKKDLFIVVESMQKAIEIASQSAEKGDVVLLSPGSASFGIFKNEFDRGEQFRKEVISL